jgi:hypothetical protein
VTARDLRGKRLWSWRSKDGISDAAPIHLDENSTGVIVGYNGDGGIKVLDANGSVILKIDGPVNVWSVCASRHSGSLANCILAVNGHLACMYALSGEKLAEYRPGGGVNAVGAIDLDGDLRDEVITISTWWPIATVLSAFKPDGDLLWSKVIEPCSPLRNRPIFPITIDGLTEIAVATESGVRFYSSQGELTGRIFLEISGADRMPTTGLSDRIVLRGKGFLRCLELTDQA